MPQLEALFWFKTRKCHLVRTPPLRSMLLDDEIATYNFTGVWRTKFTLAGTLNDKMLISSLA